MDEMADSIVVKRLVRNLQYRQTYLSVFEALRAPGFHPLVVKLLSLLIETQQTAIVTLSSYLRGLSIETEDLLLYQRLMEQAAQRRGTSSQLRFIHYGLSKAVSWYRMQLVDRQMTADPELRSLLLELGGNDAACLWRTEAVMIMLRMRPEPVPKAPRGPSRAEPDQEEGWRSRLMGTSRRPAWSGEQPTIWPTLSRARSDG
jgi:hypothetical protein